ncbi:hypothetical protein MUP07_03655 [Candidatus Bathyarchaeota archaeon]|nr:hypothetical protein [Candidatus Bathyarchaeota archaeon]
MNKSAQVSTSIVLGRWQPTWYVFKFRDPENIIARQLWAGMTEESVIKKFPSALYEAPLRMPGNLLLNEGIDEIFLLIASTGATLYNNANARMGVGNGTTPASPSQTGLQGASTAFKAMDATYPQVGTQKGIWRSSFGAAEANFAWEEMTIDNGSVRNRNLCRKVQAMETKTSDVTWVARLDVTIV